MSKAGGLVLILGGLAVAAYVMPSDNDASGPDAAGQIDVAKSARVGRASEPGHRGAEAPTRLPADRAGAGPCGRARARASRHPSSSRSRRVPSEPSAAPPRAAAIPRDRDTLARELQKELRRVGCYDGELNGAWTPLTRRAMKAFTDRVNATLPVEEPDAVLFAMVQGQQDRVCGKPCPAGQGISEDGRCLPNAILAKATKKASAAGQRRAVAEGQSGAGREAGTRDHRLVDDHDGRAHRRRLSLHPHPRSHRPGPPASAPPTEGRMALAGPTTSPSAAGRVAAGHRPPRSRDRRSSTPRAAQARRAAARRTGRAPMNARRFESPN